jgi:hypothetical protein
MELLAMIPKLLERFQKQKIGRTCMRRISGIACVVTALLILAPTVSAAQEGEAADLAKQTQNPVADLISVPFQNNTNFGIGPHDRIQNVLNIQPVIPFGLSENWNLIARIIAPVIYQPDIFEESGGSNFLGDINATAFLAPKDSGEIIWGVGPVMLFPTASKEEYGSKKWGLGPSAVVLTMNGPWVVGVLANNIWSVAGDEERGDINQMLVQYFINYNLPDGWVISSAPIITANWEADSDSKWTVPFGGGVGKLFRIGKLPINGSLHYYYNAKKPEFGADWTLRAQIQLLFPK